MRVKAGNVIKNIPIGYLVGFEMMLDEDFDHPKKIRLSKWERFRVALYTWESQQSRDILRFLEGSNPQCAIYQFNRRSEVRWIVQYTDIDEGENCYKHVIVPRSVADLCPDKREDYIDWT